MMGVVIVGNVIIGVMSMIIKNQNTEEEEIPILIETSTKHVIFRVKTLLQTTHKIQMNKVWRKV